MNTRGVALYLVLAVLLVVTILANVILTLISSQNKLADHHVRRIQAYYAAQAGVNYALENIRVGNWVITNASSSQVVAHICRASGSAPCNPPTYVESSFPHSIKYVRVVAGPQNATSGLTPVSVSVNYTSD